MGLDAICNYLEISNSIGTGGQPTAQQFAIIAAAGYEAVINLAMSDSTNAIPQERELVEGLGMTYVHIPVVWENPTEADLTKFFETLDRYLDRRVFVHCVLNYRVSVFVLLYRVLRLGLRPDSAWKAVRQIWEPNDIWMSFAGGALDQQRVGSQE
jgi:protein tyrosine phosphatase (PTP) superfamily phosphohydrolase (DUF442 family)